MNTLPERLRAMARDIRRRPIPLADVIPLLTEAADEIDTLIVCITELNERGET